MLRARRHSVHGKSRRLSIDCLEDRALPSFLTAPSFLVSLKHGTGSHPVAVATGDFNGDGKTDVATANRDSNTVSVLLGSGRGTFKSPLQFAVGKNPSAILAVDLNGDGRLDLVTANKDDNTVSVLLGTGLGTFKPAGILAAGSGPVALAAGDVNGDGHVDLAVADSGASAVTLLLGDGAQHFSPGGTVAVGSSPTSVVVRDFNNDNKPDIASVSGGFGHLDINLNNGDGSFASPVNYATGFVANTVVAGDFNHDGQPDLAVACNFPSGDGVSILLGNPDGTFQAFAKYNVGQTPATLAVADFNGDGVQDLVTANGQFANNSVSVLIGNGDGTFGTAHVFTAGQSPVGVAVGDFNGDGVPDAVVADSGAFLGPTGRISVLLGNGDGTLLAAPDLVVNGPGPSAQADFNGDGSPDLAVVTANTDYSGVTVFANQGNGLFGAPLQTATIDKPTAVAVGDFNGDHTPDLAVTNGDSVSILLGDGTGGFAAPVAYAAGIDATQLVVDDFNGDGFLDLAVADNSAGSVSILLGKGDGTFATATSVSAGGAANYLASADLNGDGNKDLAVVNGSANTVSVVLGLGDGSFGTATSYKTEVGPGSVSIGDFNGDHRPDLAVATFFGPKAGSAVTALLNQGKGTFAAGVEYSTDSRPQGSAAIDLNGDHKLDIVAVNNFADDLFVLPGTGTGSFGKPTGYVVGDGPSWLTATDFNGDGAPDLAVTNGNANTLTLLESPATVATHFRVHVVPASVTAGTPFQVVVVALDARNHLITDYKGTVSLTSSDGAAVLPSGYKFTSADHGVHRFTVTLKAAGSTDIVAHAGSLTGTDTATVVAAQASQLKIIAPSSATAGSPFDVTVTTYDRYGNVATGFLGTVHFATSDLDPTISLPADYPFTVEDSGAHLFQSGVTLRTAGSQTVTVSVVKAKVKASVIVNVIPPT
jgi:hypothetical protein